MAAERDLRGKDVSETRTLHVRVEAGDGAGDAMIVAMPSGLPHGSGKEAGASAAACCEGVDRGFGKYADWRVTVFDDDRLPWEGQHVAVEVVDDGGIDRYVGVVGVRVGGCFHGCPVGDHGRVQDDEAEVVEILVEAEAGQGRGECRVQDRPYPFSSAGTGPTAGADLDVVLVVLGVVNRRYAPVLQGLL